MKHLFAIIFLSTALVNSPAQAQTSAPGNAAPGLPQLSFPSTTSNPATPTPAETGEQVSIPVPADPAAAFAAAVAVYEKGNYARARLLFEGAEKKAVSIALEYNLGNACYQSHDYGAAVLHYLRALSLDPRDPDVRQNLALARKAASISAPDESRLDRFSAFFARNTWAWIAVMASWAALYLGLLPQLYRWRGVLPWLLCITALAIAVAAGVGLWGTQQHAHDGVVLRADTPLNLSPTANSTSVSMLQPGEIARTLEQHGNYFKVRAANGQLGWVEAAKYSPVWN